MFLLLAVLLLTLRKSWRVVKCHDAPLKTGVDAFSCTALDWIVEIPVKYFSPAVHWISIWGRDSVILSSVDMRYLMKAGSSKYLDLDLLAMF